MDDSWRTDDDRLLRELGEAMRTAPAVPEAFVRAGKAAFAWHDIDAELARLSFDSALTEPAERAAAGMRSDRPAVRSLTFVSGSLTVEIEVHPDAMRGQVVPPQGGTVELHAEDDSVRSFPIDDVGWFVIRPVPVGPVRLRVRTDSGGTALTEWITV